MAAKDQAMQTNSEKKVIDRQDNYILGMQNMHVVTELKQSVILQQSGLPLPIININYGDIAKLPG